MAEIASAFVSIAPSMQGFSSKLSAGVTSSTSSVGKSAGTAFGKVFALAAGAVAAVGIGSFLKDSIAEAREAQKVGAQTAAVIKSTGAAAGITADQVGKMAGRISALTGIDDEAIQSGANLLLTFTNIRNEVGGKFTGTFDAATNTIVDMSAALGTDVKASAIQVGKALNDPIAGVSALSRVGVTFNEQQKEQIKTMVEAGNVTGAQTLILSELNKEFGGSAQATATFGDKAAVAFGNIKEQVGTALLPLVDSFFKLFLKSVPTITAAIDGIGPALGRVQAFLAPFIAQISGLFSGGGGGGLMAGLSSLGSAVQANLLPVLQTMATTFQTVILPAIVQFVGYLRGQLGPVFTQVVGVITSQVLPILASLAQFFYGKLYPAILGAVAVVAKNLQPAFEAIVRYIQAAILPAISALLAKFREYQPQIEKVVLVIVKVTGAVLALAAQIVSAVLPKVLAFQTAFVQKLIPAIGTAIDIIATIIGWLVKAGAAFIDGVQKVTQFQKAVAEKIAAALRIIAEIPGKVANALGDLGSYLFTKGQALIQGLINGILSKLSAVGDAIGSVASKIKGYLPGSPVKEGPLKSWNDGGAGKRLMDLLAGGITASETKVAEAMSKALDKVVQVAEAKRDRIATVVDGLKSSFASLADSIASAFSPNDLLSQSGSTLDLFSGLLASSDKLRNLQNAVNVLKGFGVSGGFIAQLLQSGNYPLILDLAAGGKSNAVVADTLFGGINAQAAGLGSAVADQEFGKELRQANQELREIKRNTRELQNLDRKLARALNDAVRHGERSAA